MVMAAAGLTAGLLAGSTAKATPWDERLCAAMTAADVTVHEEATVDLLLADLREGAAGWTPADRPGG
jgi:hypothetical protein